MERELHSLHLRDVFAAANAVSAHAMWLAAACTALSYALLTGYDLLGFRYLRKSAGVGRATFVSFIANSFGHNLGFASLTGAAVRVRLYADNGLSALEAATISGFCSLTSCLGLATLIGGSLLLRPDSAVGALHMHSGWIIALGGAALLLVMAYWLWARLPERVLEFRGWALHAPGAGLAAQQIILGGVDMAASAAVLWLLLPAGTDVAYIHFVGAYAIAVVAGLLSHLPGGIGVFEAVLLLMMPQVSPEAMLGSLLIYRAFYYLLPLSLAAPLFVLRELALQRSRLLRAHTVASALISPLVPWIGGVLAFVSGCVLLVSGATPALDARLHLLREAMPLPVLELSHLTASCVGLGLLVLARGLTQRTRAALQLTLILLAAGAVASLLKGLDFEEALALTLIGGLLWSSRSAFYRPAAMFAERFTPAWLASVAAVLAIVFWIGVLAHRHVDYSNELWWTFAFSGDAPRMLRASLLTVLLAGALIAFSLLRPRPPAPALPSANELESAAAIIALDDQSLGNVALTGDKRLLFNEKRDALLMYQVRGRSWIALGDPVGNADGHEELLWSFRELADRHGGWPVFYEVSGDRLHQYVDLGLSALKLGEEARVALSDFSVDGSARAALRHARRRAERDGASFEVFPATAVKALLPQLTAISDAWLADKATAEKSFSVGTFEAGYLQRFPLALVRMAGEPVAFANLWGSAHNHELSVDLMRFGLDAPRGAMDYLFIELMLWGRAQGYHWFNLGMAPLAGLENHPLAPVWHRVGNFLFEHGEHFYNFEGLRRYKSKFDPQWRPRYIMTPGGLALPRILLDVSLLISGGAKGLITK